ncbi:C-type mannose receptor 2-like [Schistocerca nitens]|uniref:C-type mannose receptor 2-like n=1 Tax=Schistocerca nitens TaxID=7011 RepID=UPI002117FF61|nr:C-type mannose receptor 2-like [Schistocerca nitens]
MRLLPAWTILAVSVTRRALASVDMSCDCRMWHLMDTSVSLHCTRGRNGASVVSCQKAEVLDTPRGYHYVPGYALIRLSRIFMTWPAAKKTCEDEGAQLAIPPDQYAFDGLRRIFSTVQGIWYANIGVTDQVSEGVFLDIHGRPVSYLPWQPNQPDNYGDKEDCVDFNIVGLSNDVNCENPAPFFCERRLSVGIPPTYVWLDDASRFYKVHTEKRLYAEAAKVCRSENATLAVIDTWRRGEALLSLLEPKYEFYLTGFTDEAVEGDFVTETGRHLRDMEYRVWNPGEPNNYDGGNPENCLAVSGRGFYKDVRCDLELPFICEIAPK